MSLWFHLLQAGPMPLLGGEDDVWTQESPACTPGQALPAYLSSGQCSSWNPVVPKAILLHFLSWGAWACLAALWRDFTALQASKKYPFLVKGYEVALRNVRRFFFSLQKYYLWKVNAF